jgi:hypothetical protein
LVKRAWKVAPPVVVEDDRLSVDHGLVRVEGANRLGDPRKAIREVRAAAAPERDARALLPGDERKPSSLTRRQRDM